MKGNPVIYALYKGENFIDLGTINELSRKLGIKIGTLRFYASPTYKSRGLGDQEGNRLCLVRAGHKNDKIGVIKND